MEEHPRLEEWRSDLAEPLAKVMGGASRIGDITLLCEPKEVDDDTTKLLVRDSLGRPSAVILGSPRAYPDAVRQAMERAQAAKRMLGPRLGSVVLEPLDEGWASGKSYAVLPYCSPLRGDRLFGRLQRMTVIPSLLIWLREVALASRSEPKGGSDPEFRDWLEHLASLQAMPSRVRTASERALDRLSNGDWTPRRVLLHGDFWSGNVLIHRQTRKPDGPNPPWQHLALIDWGGSRIDGVPIFDLLRIAKEQRLGRRRLRSELTAHCQILSCDLSDASSYLALALGELGLRLEQFPMNRFVAMADSLFAVLQTLGGEFSDAPKQLSK